MPVQDAHPLYNKNLYAWWLSRDSLEGEVTIKRANTRYLPMPSGMLDLPPAPSTTYPQSYNYHDYTNHGRLINHDDLPSYSGNPAYSAYLQRAHYPGIVAATCRGLTGLATAKAPTITLPPAMEYLEVSATPSGKGLEQLYKEVLSHALAYGRVVLALDVVDEQIKIQMYPATSFINWQTMGQSQELTLAVMEELVLPPIEGDADEFSHERKVAHRVMRISQDVGAYETQVYIDGSPVDEPIIPIFQGRALPFLPLQVIGATDNDIDPDIIPLEPLCQIALSIYHKSADVNQAEFMTCNSTLVISGVQEGEEPTKMGATVGIFLEDPQARASYPSADSNSIDKVLKHIDMLWMEALNYGGNMLGGNTKRAAETAEALRIQRSSAGVTLLDVTRTVSRGIERTLKQVALWMGQDVNAVSFRGATDFAEHYLAPQDHKVLLESFLNGAISHETYLHNLERGGILQDGVDVDEELARIQAQGPVFTQSTFEPVQEEPEEDPEEDEQGNEING